MLLDDVKITRKVDNMIKIYEKENEYGLKNENSRDRIIYFKREFLKYLIFLEKLRYFFLLIHPKVPCRFFSAGLS